MIETKKHLLQDTKLIDTFLKTPSELPKLIVIYGPTASWKTAMSIDIAKYLDTEIISADSRQIFRNMDIWTGKITQEEKQGIPHHMIDIVDPNEVFSLWEFVRQAEKVLQNLYQKKKIPMLVGGTGLYIDSIIFERNASDVSTNTLLRKGLETLTKQELYQKLQEIDPEYAKELHPNNRPYVERAIEVKLSTGKSKQEFRAEKKLKYDVLFLHPDFADREKLYQRIDTRVEKMLESWAEEELKKLMQQWYTQDDFAMNTIGYKEFFPYFQGKISWEELRSKIQQHSRNYAKRQITWFKKYEALKKY